MEALLEGMADGVTRYLLPGYFCKTPQKRQLEKSKCLCYALLALPLPQSVHSVTKPPWVTGLADSPTMYFNALTQWNTNMIAALL
jgi:hypothetical protein